MLMVLGPTIPRGPCSIDSTTPSSLLVRDEPSSHRPTILGHRFENDPNVFFGNFGHFVEDLRNPLSDFRAVFFALGKTRYAHKWHFPHLLSLINPVLTLGMSFPFFSDIVSRLLIPALGPVEERNLSSQTEKWLSTKFSMLFDGHNRRTIGSAPDQEFTN